MGNIFILSIRVPGTNVALSVNSIFVSNRFTQAGLDMVFIEGIPQAFELVSALDTGMSIK